jgi:hypothetical protein
MFAGFQRERRWVKRSRHPRMVRITGSDGAFRREASGYGCWPEKPLRLRSGVVTQVLLLGPGTRKELPVPPDRAPLHCFLSLTLSLTTIGQESHRIITRKQFYLTISSKPIQGDYSRAGNQPSTQVSKWEPVACRIPAPRQVSCALACQQLVHTFGNKLRQVQHAHLPPSRINPAS